MMMLLALRYIDYVDGSIMTDGTFYDVTGQAFGAVSNKTRGQFHKPFCAQCRAFPSCTKHLPNNKAFQKLGIGHERSAVGPKQKSTQVVKKYATADALLQSILLVIGLQVLLVKVKEV